MYGIWATNSGKMITKARYKKFNSIDFKNSLILLDSLFFIHIFGIKLMIYRSTSSHRINSELLDLFSTLLLVGDNQLFKTKIHIDDDMCEILTKNSIRIDNLLNYDSVYRYNKNEFNLTMDMMKFIIKFTNYQYTQHRIKKTTIIGTQYILFFDGNVIQFLHSNPRLNSTPEFSYNLKSKKFTYINSSGNDYKHELLSPAISHIVDIINNNIGLTIDTMSTVCNNNISKINTNSFRNWKALI